MKNKIVVVLVVCMGLVAIMGLAFAQVCTTFERTVYPNIYAKEVLIQKVDPLTKQPVGLITVGSPRGREWNGTTNDLPYIEYYEDRWLC